MEFFVLLLSTVLYIATVNSQISSRNQLFPQLVQDFVADAFDQFLADADDPDVISAQRISPDEAYSVFFDMVYKAGVEAGNPDSKFHAQCKAQSVRDNYQYADGSYIFLAAAYTAGELMLQNEILTPQNQPSLSSRFTKALVDPVKALNDPSNTAENLRVAHGGFVDFISSQGLTTKRKAFTDPAVFVEVMNALRL